MYRKLIRNDIISHKNAFQCDVYCRGVSTQAGGRGSAWGYLPTGDVCPERGCCLRGGVSAQGGIYPPDSGIDTRPFVDTITENITFPPTMLRTVKMFLRETLMSKNNRRHFGWAVARSYLMCAACDHAPLTTWRCGPSRQFKFSGLSLADISKTLQVYSPLADLGGARPARAPPFAWHPSFWWYFGTYCIK